MKVTGYPPLHLEDTYSGDRFKGPAGLVQALSPLAKVLQVLGMNTVEPIRVESIECWAEVQGARRSATIVHAYAPQPELSAGDTLEVIVELQPYRSNHPKEDEPRIIKRSMKLSLPISLSPGDYVADVAAAPEDFQKELRHHPRWTDPRTPSQLHQSLSEQLENRHTDLVLRVETKDVGLGIDSTEFPDLPSGKVSILANNGSNEVYRFPSRSSCESEPSGRWKEQGPFLSKSWKSESGSRPVRRQHGSENRVNE